MLFRSRICHAFASDHCCLVVTCWERADLLALVCDVKLCFCHFPLWCSGGRCGTGLNRFLIFATFLTFNTERKHGDVSPYHANSSHYLSSLDHRAHIVNKDDARCHLFDHHLLAPYLTGPRREITCLRGFRQSVIQTSLLSYRD